jgi:outer membrane receptor for ferrienterochelin and colicins
MQKFIKLLLLFSAIQSSLLGQESVITGKVRDNNGDLLPGAAILEKGTTNGTSASDDGSFTLTLTQTETSVIVRAVGFAERSYKVKAGGVYVFTLLSADIGLNQVVVSASKRGEKVLDAPASVSVIQTEKLQRNVVTTPVDYLKTTPGVDVMRTGLVSANVTVRGFNNIFSGSVMNIVDNRIGAVPSLRVNAYQLVPSNSLDIEKIEVVRGPASALYGPNSSSGVVHIMTKSPLDLKKRTETTISMNSGFHTPEKPQWIVNPEFRFAMKVNDKVGFKISGSYLRANDFENYDDREPFTGDSILFGTEANGTPFVPDTLRYITLTGSQGQDSLVPELDIRRFARNFQIEKWSLDGRLDYRPINDLTLTLSGGVSSSKNIELTGLGAAQTGSRKPLIGWIYGYAQARLRWKELFFQYFMNTSNSGETFLIPQLGPSDRASYNSSSPPSAYPVRKLTDQSIFHNIQLQHAFNKLGGQNINVIYGLDFQLTNPRTKGTINGRFEDKDNLWIAGGYAQGEYQPWEWFKVLAAFRLDYNNIIKNVAFSPRAALVFKPHATQTIRVTFNRAYDSPSTLNQFLDLSNGLIPNGINIRGIGNPGGYNYRYDNSGNIQFITAPYGGSQGTWNTLNDKTNNYLFFDSAVALLVKGLAAQAGFPVALVQNIVINPLLNGIKGQNGTVQNANHIILDYANFAQTKNFQSSVMDASNFRNISRINNSTTQTLELGYKGLLGGKVSLSIDGYWTRITNFVSPLRVASGAVMLEWQSFLGQKDPTGILYQNLMANGGNLNNLLLPLLNNNPDFTNNSIVTSDSNTVWDELIVLFNQLPVGTVTPDNDKVNSDFILTYQNVGTIDVFGLDLGAQINLTDDIVVGASYSWVDKNKFTLKGTNGESVSLNAPRNKFALTYDHNITQWGFNFGLTYRWQQEYEAQSSLYFGKVEQANLVDFRVGYNPRFFKNMTLSMDINNLMNQRWRPFPGTPAMGTTMLWRLAFRF